MGQYVLAISIDKVQAFLYLYAASIGSGKPNE